MDDDGAQAEEVYEVESILRYRRNEDGEEHFLVKWLGYPEEEATWEPLRHMNDNCRELIAKARALFAWRKPAQPAVHVAADAEEAKAKDPVVVPTPAASAPVEVLLEDDDEDAGIEEAPEELPEDDWGAIPEVEEEGVEEADVEPRPPPGRRPSDSSMGGSQKRQKVQQGSVDATSQSKAPHAPSTPQPRTMSRDDTKRPLVAREMKCICGATDKVNAAERASLVVCRVCLGGLHPGCVQSAINGRTPPEDYVCPPCRIERVDDFHPPVGAGLLRHSYASASSTLQLVFAAQMQQWQKQQWAVHLRAVSTGNTDLGGPAWPHRVQGKLNGRQCVQIDPPKHLHVRREQCYNLTPLIRQGVNTLELRLTPKPDKPRGEPDESYCVGVVLTRPRSVASMISRIRSRSSETVASGRSRVERLLAQVASKEQGQEDVMVTGHFGRILRPLCPVSFCPIEEATIGRNCNHVQVFDLQAYIAVNQRMRSLDKRWTCPVCSQPARPDDLILDPFAQGILDTLRGDEDLVEAVVFNEDCSWSTVSAVKDDAKAGGGGDEGGDAAGRQNSEFIDLSDSE